MRHLDLDVLAAHANLDFIHDVGDGLHGVGHVPLAEFFFRRDEADTLLEQFSLRDRRIREVSEDARSHVNHDVPHVRMLIDVAQQSLELWSLRDRLGRLARFDELVRHRGSELPHLAERLDALGSNTVSVVIDVGSRVELARCRDAQVQDRLRDCNNAVFARACWRRCEQSFQSVE
ncbi:MAG: hypothetical protein WAQ27_00025 [Candidatus Microsaccharimonas sp.]